MCALGGKAVARGDCLRRHTLLLKDQTENILTEDTSIRPLRLAPNGERLRAQPGVRCHQNLWVWNGAAPPLMRTPKPYSIKYERNASLLRAAPARSARYLRATM